VLQTKMTSRRLLTVRCTISYRAARVNHRFRRHRICGIPSVCQLYVSWLNAER